MSFKQTRGRVRMIQTLGCASRDGLFNLASRQTPALTLFCGACKQPRGHVIAIAPAGLDGVAGREPVAGLVAQLASQRRSHRAAMVRFGIGAATPLRVGSEDRLHIVP